MCGSHLTLLCIHWLACPYCHLIFTQHFLSRCCIPGTWNFISWNLQSGGKDWTWRSRTWFTIEGKTSKLCGNKKDPGLVWQVVGNEDGFQEEVIFLLRPEWETVWPPSSHHFYDYRVINCKPVFFFLVQGLSEDRCGLFFLVLLTPSATAHQ